MRIRIALATALAATFMISSFHIRSAAALAATGSHIDHPVNHRHRDSLVLDIYPSFAVTGVAPAAGGGTVTDHLLWGRMLNDALRRASTAAPAAPAVPAVPVTDATSTATPDWQCIRVQESGNVYNDPTRPSGAYGILQVTWNSNGFYGWPYQAAPALQDALALKLYGEYGWLPWSSRFACGLG